MPDRAFLGTYYEMQMPVIHSTASRRLDSSSTDDDTASVKEPAFFVAIAKNCLCDGPAVELVLADGCIRLS